MRTLIYSNIFIAVAAALVTLESDSLLGAVGWPGALAAVVLVGTLIVYNLDRLADPQPGDSASPRHVWIDRHRRALWVVVAVSSVLLLALLPLLPWRTLGALAGLGLIATAYSFPLLARVPRVSDRLREIAEFKALLVAAVWTVVTVVLPAIEFPRLSLALGDVGLLAVERFLFVAAITMPFDLRDRERDAAVGLRTLSVRLGLAGTRRLSVGMMTVSTVLAGVHWYPPPLTAGAFVLSGGVTIALLAMLREGLSEWYYGFALDGTLILQAVLVLAAGGIGGVG